MLKRECLRDQIAEELRTRIISGRLSAESGLSEVELAKELGVSRTPLREALVRLEQEGFLEASPGKGFAVLSMHESDYSKLVPIIGAIEKIALLALPPLTEEQFSELESLNQELLAGSKLPYKKDRVEACIKADLLFHDLLLESSTNDKALQILRQLKAQWRRYEYVFWSATEDVGRSVKEHEGIITSLKAGDKAQAASLIEAQWSLCLVERLVK